MSTPTVMQNVNLYLPEFRQKKYWLDAEKTVFIAAAGIVLMVVTSGVEFWQLMQLRGDLAKQEQEYQQAVAATNQLLASYGEQTEDPALLADIQKLEEDLQSKEALLQYLEGRELGNAEGFSEYLADLSRHHVKGLSVNYVSLTKGGQSVELEGEVLTPDLAPIYLDELAKGSAYAGMNFERLQIEAVAATADIDTNAMEFSSWRVRSLEQ